MQIDIHPDQRNWERFCQEPELSPEEWATWYQLAAVARESEELRQFIHITAADEIAEYYQKDEYTPGDWSDLVQSADKHRRYKRAVIAAWKLWQQREEETDA